VVHQHGLPKHRSRRDYPGVVVICFSVCSAASWLQGDGKSVEWAEQIRSDGETIVFVVGFNFS